MGGEKHIVGFNVFDNHDVYALIPQNTESGEPEIKNIGEIFQYNMNFTLSSDIINAR